MIQSETEFYPECYQEIHSQSKIFQKWRTSVFPVPKTLSLAHEAHRQLSKMLIERKNDIVNMN